jgi:hypothetical protein
MPKKLLHFYCFKSKDYELKTSLHYRAQKQRFARRRRKEREPKQNSRTGANLMLLTLERRGQPRGDAILIYCRSGAGRSAAAAEAVEHSARDCESALFSRDSGEAGADQLREAQPGERDCVFDDHFGR